MPLAIQAHTGERLRETAQKPGGIAHTTPPRPRVAPSLGSVAARISGSGDRAARARTAVARGSWLQPVASADRAATSSGDLAGNLDRRKNGRLPSAIDNNTSRAGGDEVCPRRRI